MAPIEQVFYAAGLLVTLIAFSAWMLSLMSTQLVRLSRSVFGVRLTMILIESPALFLHEMSHLVVAVIFGHRIVEVNLKGMFKAGAGGHVMTQYNTRSFYQRLGLFLMAIAPFALPMILLLVVLVRTYGYPTPTGAGDWVREIAATPLTAWSGTSLAIALYLHLVVSATLRLSGQDWLTAAQSAPIWILIAVLFAVVTYPPSMSTPWAWPPVLLLATGLLFALAAKLFAVLTLSLLSLCRQMVGAATR